MNSEIGEVAEIDYRTLLGRLRGNYNFSMALINSYEFATFDGHDSICFYYGDEKRKEPSVWYVNLELKKAFELAMDFETFLCNLLVKRKDYAISITKLNDDTVCYIEDLIQNVFADNHFSLDINDLINATKDRWGYSYKKEGKFNVEVAQNKYFDNSGYRVPEYKDVEWVLKIKPHVNGSSDLSCEKFIQEYESKIQEVSKKYKKAGINILHEMGFHKFVDEISE